MLSRLGYWKLLPMAVVLYGCGSLPSSASSSLQTESVLSGSVDRLIQQLTQTASDLENRQVAVADFTDASGQKTELTAFLTNKFIDRLTKTGKVRLVERNRLDAVMKELNLSMTGYIDERSEKLLGKMLGAGGLMTGTVTDLGESLDVTVRLIQTETGEVLAAADVELLKDRKIQTLAGRVLAKPTADYRPPLELRMNLIAQRKTGAGGYEEVEIGEGAVLRSGDNIQVHFSANADCNVYILIFDSQKKASRLFPDQKIVMSNKVKANMDYSVPPGDQWFYLDEHTGTETIYVLASYEPMSHLDTLLSEMERTSGNGKEGEQRTDEVSDQIRENIGTLYRGMGPTEKPKPPRPIEIAGTIGRETTRGGTERGVGGVRPGSSREFRLSDGRTVQKVTEVVRGYATAVRAIRFEHRD